MSVGGGDLLLPPLLSELAGNGAAIMLGLLLLFLLLAYICDEALAPARAFYIS
jgi:hypothetical protein